jgi:hypothetical protein
MEFDWDRAIKINSEALQRIVAALFAMAGLAGAVMSDVLPRHIYRNILLILRPAESAVRRLILMASRGLVVKVGVSRPAPAGFSIPQPREGSDTEGPERIPAFQIIDPRKRFDWFWKEYANEPGASAPAGVPRIVSFDGNGPQFAPPPPLYPEDDGPGGPAQLIRRLLAIKGALDDLPKQARRLARWRARRELTKNPNGHLAKGYYTCSSRPGLPPGWSDKRRHDIDDILKECHALAKYACETPNTS